MNMNEIKDLEERMSDQKTLETYQKYRKYEEMLNVYTILKSDLFNQRNVTNKTVTAIYEKHGFITDDEKDQVGDFIEYIDGVLEKNPKLNDEILIDKLRDLTSQKNRTVIGGLIAKFQKDDNFVTGDLDAVAVLKNYGLYKSVFEFQQLKKTNELSNDSLDKIFSDNKISPEMFNNAYGKVVEMEKTQTEPENRFKLKDSSDLVNITATILEMSPAEARRNLEGLQRINQSYKPELGGVIIVREEEENIGALEGNANSKEEYLEGLKRKREEIETNIKTYFNRHKGATIEDFAIKYKDYCERNNILAIPMNYIKEDDNILKDIPKENQIHVRPNRAKESIEDERSVG